MARITIASLQLIVAQQDTALEALRTEVNHYMDVATRQDALIASLTVERDELLVALQAERDALLVAQRPSRRITYQAPRTAERPISDYKRACEAARAMAVATGRAVRVG